MAEITVKFLVGTRSDWITTGVGGSGPDPVIPARRLVLEDQGGGSYLALFGNGIDVYSDLEYLWAAPGAAVWGSITGTLTDQADLATALSGKQPVDSDLSAIAGLTPSNDDVVQRKAGAWINRTPAQLKTDLVLVKGDVGLGNVTNDAQLKASDLDNDTTLAADSASKIPSQHAVKSYVDLAVTGLWDFKGATDCSANPNYPAALKGDAYVVSVAGKIGGGSGKSVDVADLYVAIADNAGGTEASVGTSWIVLEHNLVGALLAANNLSDVASAATARTNLGLAIGTNVQAFDADLATIAGLTATTDNFLVAVASAWASRTPAQVKATLAITEADVAGLVADLAAKAPLASPVFTTSVTLPTGLTGPLRADAGVVSNPFSAQLTSTFTRTNDSAENTAWTPANMAAAALVANQTLLHIRIGGTLDVINTTGGIITCKLKINGTLVCTFFPLALQQTGGALSAQPWWADFDIYVDAVGGLGQVTVEGIANNVTTNSGGVNPRPSVTTTGLSLTAGLQLTLTEQMSIANAGNTIRVVRARTLQIA